MLWMGKSTISMGHLPLRPCTEVTEFVGTQIDDIETYAIGCSLSLV